MSGKEAVIKMEYEIMHTPVQELALTHDMSESIIRSYIKAQGWERMEYNDESEKLEKVNERLQAMGTMSQASLTPRFLRLQAQVLDKAYSLLDQITKLEDSHFLKIINEVIEAHRPHIMGDPNKGKNGGNVDGLTSIRIMTQVGGGDKPSTSAVEITQTAGVTNGQGSLERLI